MCLNTQTFGIVWCVCLQFFLVVSDMSVIYYLEFPTYVFIITLYLNDCSFNIPLFRYQLFDLWNALHFGTLVFFIDFNMFVSEIVLV